MIRVRISFWLVQGDLKQQFVCSKESNLDSRACPYLGYEELMVLAIQEIEIMLARQIGSGKIHDLDKGIIDLDDTWEIKS